MIHEYLSIYLSIFFLFFLSLLVLFVCLSILTVSFLIFPSFFFSLSLSLFLPLSLSLSLTLSFFLSFTITCPVGWGCRLGRLYLCSEVRYSLPCRSVECPYVSFVWSNLLILAKIRVFRKTHDTRVSIYLSMVIHRYTVSLYQNSPT